MRPISIVRAIDVAGREPAHSDDMEQRCVGAVLDFGHRALDAVLAACTLDDLYRPASRTVLEAARDLHARGEAVDTSTVARELDSHGRLLSVGGVAGLVALTGRASSPESVEPYAKALASLAHQRRVTEAAAEIHARGFEQSGDPASFIEFAAQRIGAACERQGEAELHSVGDVMDAHVPDLVKQWHGEREPFGMRSGLTEYDAITRGWHPGQLHVVAAYAGGGKSAFALQTATHIADSVYDGDHCGVLFIAGEMTERELVNRQLCQVAGVTDDELQTGSGDTGKIVDAADRLRSLPLFFHDRSVSVHEIPALVRKAQRRCDRVQRERRTRIRLVVIDYLQIMRLERAERQDIAIGNYTRACKQMASDLGVHVMLISQFSREAAKKGGRPSMFELRESGAIENDASLITFVHRPSITMEPESEEARLTDSMCEVIVGKARGRGKGTQLVAYRGPHFRFEVPSAMDLEQWRRGREMAKGRGKR